MERSENQNQPSELRLATLRGGQEPVLVTRDLGCNVYLVQTKNPQGLQEVLVREWDLRLPRKVELSKDHHLCKRVG